MLHCEQSGEKDIIVYYANGRTEKVTDFYPYFYDEDKNKIMCKSPMEVKERKQQYPQTFEADIPYTQRFMIDRVKVPIEREEIRVNFLDIETLMSIDTVNVPVPVLAITCFDSVLKQYYTFTWKVISPESKFPDKFPDQNWHIYSCKDEETMLEKFLAFVQATDPDMLTGWNCLPGDVLIQTPSGDMTLKDIYDKKIDFVYGFNHKSNKIEEQAIRTYVKQIKCNMIKIKTLHGFEIVGTADHKIFCRDSSTNGIYKKMEEFNKGDKVLIRRPKIEQTNNVNLFNILMENDTFHDKIYITNSDMKNLKQKYFNKYGDGQKLFNFYKQKYGAGKCNCLFQGTKYARYLRRLDKVIKYLKLFNVSNKDIYDFILSIREFDYGRSRCSKDTVDNINDKIFYYIGLILTDGTYSKKWGMRFYNTNLELLNAFKKFLMEDLKVSSATINRGSNEPTTKNLKISNRLFVDLYYYITNLEGNKSKSDTKMKKDILCNLSNIQAGMLIAGILDGDGNVDGIPSISNISFDTRKTIQKILLKSLNMISRVNQESCAIRIDVEKKNNEIAKKYIIPYMKSHKKTEAYNKLFNSKGRWNHELNKTDIFRDKVIQIDKFEKETEVYDIETDLSNFFANNILVHNCNFDISYLINRMLKLQINAHKLCRFGYAKVKVGKKKRQDVSVKGRIVFDLQSAYKKLSSSWHESSTLEHVATKELGRGKLKSGKSIKEMWETDVKALLDYNLEDVKLIVDLDNKLSIIDYFDNVRRMVGCPWSMLEHNSMMVDTLALRKAKEKGMILPTNIKREKEKEIEGGYVHLPNPGMYENIIVFDVRSLYPSIMVSCNLDPFTLSPDGDIAIGNGHKFKSEPEGLLPSIIKDLFELRKKYKTEMKKYKYGTDEYHSFDLKQYSVKVIINSIYGVCAFPKFRLFKKEVAESVTYMGREIVKFMAAVAEKEGYKLLYADTDSIFIQSKGGTVLQIAEEAQHLQKIINDSFGEYSKAKGMKNHIFYLEFEKIFSKFYISQAKKRYFGYLAYKDGKEVAEQLIVVGFEVKRSDTSKAGRRILEKIYRMLLDGKNQKEIEDYVAEIKKQMQENPRYNEIGIPKSIAKNFDDYKNMPIHVRALKYSMENLGLQHIPGEKVRFAYVFSPAGKPKTDVVGFYTEFPAGFKINWEKQMPLIVDNSLERIFSNLGWTKETKQQNLGDWFG